MENNGTAGDLTGCGANNGQGAGGGQFYCDTKWKYQSESSSEDIRQMYSYGKYWKAKQRYLLYPDRVFAHVRKENGNFYDVDTEDISTDEICGLIFIDLIGKENFLNRDIGLFILNELLLGLRVMKDKIHGIEQVTHEDRFTDLLLASLRLRFPIWGWAIIDQARTGHSPTKINAGETDLLIQAAGKNIALIEALVLTGGDFTKTSKHILKCFEYVSYLNSYYIITYYKGEAVNFDNCWNTYQGDVLKITYPSEISIDSSFGFEDLSIQFDNARNIKLAKTLHNSDVQIFHVMIKVV